MKYFLSIFIIFYVVLKPLAPIIDYAVRYDYISQVLCVNKNKPELRCDGKCYLAKEIAENTDPTSGSETPKPVIHIDLFLIKEIFTLTNMPIKPAKQVARHYIPSFYFFDLSTCVFRPPLG